MCDTSGGIRWDKWPTGPSPQCTLTFFFASNRSGNLHTHTCVCTAADTRPQNMRRLCSFPLLEGRPCVTRRGFSSRKSKPRSLTLHSHAQH